MTRPVPLAAPLLPVTGDVGALGEAERRRRAAFRVAVVSMPWAALRPQIQLGLLARIGRGHGFPVDSHHLALDLAAVIPPDEMDRLRDFHGVLEWLFGVAAFGPDPDPGEQLLQEAGGEGRRRLAAAGFPPGRLLELRHQILPAWLDRIADQPGWGRYRLVGFSCTFQQLAASFALARRLKDRYPGLRVVFGGAHFDAPMGEAWLRGVPWVDLAVTGEADRVWPTLLAALAEDRPVAGIPGVLDRDPDGQVRLTPPAPPFRELDTLPDPDYDEFFTRAGRLGLTGRLPRQGLLFEASRGCWWGEKSQCTFCGLNGTGMSYRPKSPARVRQELDRLAHRYRTRAFSATDNILAREHLPGVLDGLAADGAPYELFFTIKANLSRDDLRRLHAAGVRSVLPGIESLSSRVLGLMHKGVRASQNVNALRWAAHYGVVVLWNLIWGFPGERAADVDAQVALMPRLVHLAAPSSAARITIDRYSPIFEDRRRYPIDRLRPVPSYRRTFPATVDLWQAAYHFEGDLQGALPDAVYAPVEAAAAAWRHRQARQPPPTLTVGFTGEGALVVDRRGEDERRIQLGPAAAAACRACFDKPVNIAEVLRPVAARHGDRAAAAAVEELDAHGLVLRDGNLLLALPLPATPPRTVGGELLALRG